MTKLAMAKPKSGLPLQVILSRTVFKDPVFTALENDIYEARERKEAEARQALKLKQALENKLP